MLPLLLLEVLAPLLLELLLEVEVVAPLLLELLLLVEVLSVPVVVDVWPPFPWVDVLPPWLDPPSSGEELQPTAVMAATRIERQR